MRRLTPQLLRSIIGPPPDVVPLNAAVVEQEDKEGYQQLRVEYSAEAGERVPAYLLLPHGISTAPAVVCHHQHASNWGIGKSEVVGLAGDPDQAIGPELARLGFVVLAPDAIAFEERNWSHPSQKAEYYELASRLVSGQTLLAKVLHDVSVGFDYLSTLDQVDKQRLGFIGHSYGGRVALWAPALDDRIKASVSNCGCVNYKDSLNREVGIQMEFCVPNILDTCDVEDVIRLIAPRALYISATANDKYSRGATRMYEYAQDAFPDGQLKCKVWPGNHVFSHEMRQAAYEFLLAKLI